MYDIAIVGGGPAGATLARLVDNKYKVLLLERRSFLDNMPRASEKSCGGLLDPDAQRMMARFGLGIPKSALLSPQMFAVRTIDIANGLECYYQRHYINIDRNEFDKWLESIIPPSVTVMNECVLKSFEEKEDHVTVRFNHRGKDFEERARLLVGADGAFSTVRRQGSVMIPCPNYMYPYRSGLKPTKHRIITVPFLMRKLRIFTPGRYPRKTGLSSAQR